MIELNLTEHELMELMHDTVTQGLRTVNFWRNAMNMPKPEEDITKSIEFKYTLKQWPHYDEEARKRVEQNRPDIFAAVVSHIKESEDGVRS